MKLNSAAGGMIMTVKRDESMGVDYIYSPLSPSCRNSEWIYQSVTTYRLCIIVAPSKCCFGWGGISALFPPTYCAPNLCLLSHLCYPPSQTSNTLHLFYFYPQDFQNLTVPVVPCDIPVCVCWIDRLVQKSRLLHSLLTHYLSSRDMESKAEREP